MSARTNQPRRGVSRRDRVGRADAPAAALAAAGVRPSKRRGQNFLVKGAIADKIVAMAELRPDDAVVEIGPGLGILSERILGYPISRLYLVEMDRELAARLRTTVHSSFDLIEADFLKIDLERIGARPPIKVIGNLPFNAAAAIARKLSEGRELIAKMVLMFQREVGERLRAGAGDGAYGALSVLTALDWQITDHFRVEAGNFHPRPKVDAEVLCFVPRPVPLDAPMPRAQVRQLIRAGFAVRRKNLLNALCAGLRLSRPRVQSALSIAGIDPAQRAERLNPMDFVRLAQVLKIADAEHPQAADSGGLSIF